MNFQKLLRWRKERMISIEIPSLNSSDGHQQFRQFPLESIESKLPSLATRSATDLITSFKSHLLTSEQRLNFYLEKRVTRLPFDTYNHKQIAISRVVKQFSSKSNVIICGNAPVSNCKLRRPAVSTSSRQIMKALQLNGFTVMYVSEYLSSQSCAACMTKKSLKSSKMWVPITKGEVFRENMNNSQPEGKRQFKNWPKEDQERYKAERKIDNTEKALRKFHPCKHHGGHQQQHPSSSSTTRIATPLVTTNTNRITTGINTKTTAVVENPKQNLLLSHQMTQPISTSSSSSSSATKNNTIFFEKHFQGEEQNPILPIPVQPKGPRSIL